VGEAGREHVRRNFLMTRYLRDYLTMFQSLADQGTRRWSPRSALARHRNGWQRLRSEVRSWLDQRGAKGATDDGVQRFGSLWRRLRRR